MYHVRAFDMAGNMMGHRVCGTKAEADVVVSAFEKEGLRPETEYVPIRMRAST